MQRESPVAAISVADRKTAKAPAPADFVPVLDSQLEAQTDSHVAVVRANRSMALARVGSRLRIARDDFTAPDSDREASELETPAGSSSALSAEDDAARSTDQTGDAWTERTPNTNDETFALRSNSASNDGPQLLVDDAGTAPPALEEVRPMSPFRNVARTTKTTRHERAESNAPRVSATGWAIASAALIVCSLLAVTFYRR